MKSIHRLAAIDASSPRLSAGLPDIPLQLVVLMRTVRAASQGMSDYLAPFLQPSGFTESSLHTLMLLFASRDGTASPGSLCELVGQTRANMTRILENLSSSKLVSRAADGHDGRRQVVKITAEGRRLLREVVPAIASPLKFAMNGMTKDEIGTLVKLLRKLIESLDRGERQLQAAIQ
jgi:MarR family transcriptional regulator, negative regulator of the multidrug operon emrRAB